MITALLSSVPYVAAPFAMVLIGRSSDRMRERCLHAAVPSFMAAAALALAAYSSSPALAIAAFTVTQSEAGLFAVSAAYGLGFSGIIPAYIVAIRELFPSSEASWRVPTLLFTGMSGMAFGGWFAGALYDHFGFYAPAFAVGALFNLANLLVIGFLVTRQARQSRPAVSHA